MELKDLLPISITILIIVITLGVGGTILSTIKTTQQDSWVTTDTYKVYNETVSTFTFGVNKTLANTRIILTTVKVTADNGSQVLILGTGGSNADNYTAFTGGFLQNRNS